MGNHFSGNGKERIREIQLDLRFKVYQTIAKLFFLEEKMFKRKNRKEKRVTELANLEVQTRRKEKVKKENVDIKWIIKITLIAFIISFCLSFVSESTIPNLSLVFGVILILIFILINIISDVIGMAVTAADEKVFHSMNSRKVRGANIAVKMVKSAEKVSNFCCDVIGDICGVVSGAASASISVIVGNNLHVNLFFTTLIVDPIVASLTIGGKAIGKTFAINKSNIIIYESAKAVCLFYHPEQLKKKKR